MLFNLRLGKMFSKEAALLQQIADSRKVIRQKHLQLKLGLQDVQDDVTKVLKPIVNPLNKIANREVSTKTKKPSIKAPSKETTMEFDSFEKIPRNFHHSTPWKVPGKNLSFGLPEDEEDESETLNFQTVIEPTSSNIQNFDAISEAISSNINDSSTLSKYLELLNSGDAKIDTKFGIHKKSNRLMIGSEPISFQDGEIIIKNTSYPETAGLIELLFLKTPNEKIIKKSDIEKFIEIAQDSNLMRTGYQPNGSFKESTYNAKYLKYLKELNPAHLRASQIKGRGLPTFMIAKPKEFPLDYKYWDDPNKLVDRL